MKNTFQRFFSPRRIVLAAAVATALTSIITYTTSSRPRKIVPLAWYDFDGDGVRDVVVAQDRLEFGSDNITSNLKLNYYRATRGKFPKWASQDLYDLALVNGTNIQQRETNYFTSAQAENLNIPQSRLDTWLPIVGIGDHDNDGRIDLLIDLVDIAIPRNTHYMKRQ